MRLLGYLRRSTDQQDMSLSDQETRLQDFCDEDQDGEYGGIHELVETYGEEVSGSTYPFDRPAFSGLVDHLKRDDSIDGIVVWEFDRLARDSIRQANIRDKLRRYHIERDVDILQIDPWMPPRRSIPPIFVDELKEADDPIVAYNLRQVFMLQGNSAMWELLMTGKRTKEGLQSKKDRDEHIGRTPWGMTTDKVYYDDVDQSTTRLPGEDFEVAVEILNRQGTQDPENGLVDGLWTYAKEQGIGSPSSTIRTMWENRENYRKALNNGRANDDFDVTGLEARW